jgi:hypothetical protein
VKQDQKEKKKKKKGKSTSNLRDAPFHTGSM